MKIVDEIAIALNVDYSNQSNAVLWVLFVLEREETENQIYKHPNACFQSSGTIAKHSLP